MDADLLDKLKKAGTWFIGIAQETGSPEVMKRIKKGLRLSQVLRVREECRDLGITTHGFFMIGFPFETREDIRKTIAFAKELDTEIVEFNKVIPYAKTELYEMLVKDGALLAELSNVAKNYHEGTILTHQVGDLSQEEVKRIIRKAYRSFYLRPKKIKDLIKAFSIQDLGGFTTYAIRTRNI